MKRSPEFGNLTEEMEVVSEKNEKLTEIKHDLDFWDDFLARNVWANRELDRSDDKDEVLLELYGVYEKEKKVKAEVRGLFEREIEKLTDQTGLIIPEEAYVKLDQGVETMTASKGGGEKIAEILDELENLGKLEKERLEKEKILKETLKAAEVKMADVDRQLGQWRNIQKNEGMFSPGEFFYKFFKSDKQKEAAERVKFFEELLHEGGSVIWEKQEYEKNCLSLLNDTLKLTSAFEIINSAHNSVLAEYMELESVAGPVTSSKHLETELRELEKMPIELKTAVLSDVPAEQAAQEKTLQRVEILGSKIEEMKSRLTDGKTTIGERQELLSLVNEAEGLKYNVLSIVDPEEADRLLESNIYKIIRDTESKEFEGIEKLSDEQIIHKYFYSDLSVAQLRGAFDQMKKMKTYDEIIAVAQSFKEMAKSDKFLDTAFKIRKDFDRTMNELAPSHEESDSSREMSWIYYDLAEQSYLDKKFKIGDPLNSPAVQQGILNKHIGKEISRIALVEGENEKVKVSPELYFEKFNEKDSSYKKILESINNLKVTQPDGRSDEEKSKDEDLLKELGGLVVENLKSKKLEKKDRNAHLKESVAKYFENLSILKKELAGSESINTEMSRKSSVEAFKLSNILREWRKKHPHLEVTIDEREVWTAVYKEAGKDIKKEIGNIQNKEIKEFGHEKLLKNLEGIIDKVGSDKSARKAIRLQVIKQLDKLLRTNLKMNKKSLVHVMIADLKKS